MSLFCSVLILFYFDLLFLIIAIWMESIGSIDRNKTAILIPLNIFYSFVILLLHILSSHIPITHSISMTVIPHQMSAAGYNLINTATVCSAMSALACICSAFLTNLPFVVSPPAAVSVFLAVYIRTGKLQPHVGNVAVVYSGVGMCILGLVRPLTVFFYKVWRC